MSLEPGRLSRAASAAIQNARSKGAIFVSDMTLWEIALLAWRGRIQVVGNIETFVQEIAIASKAVQFSKEYPKDAADRLIGATALIEKLPLVTADKSLRRFHELITIW
jgi:PIN domain nuclease of toxin-antitoxin system